MDAPAFERAERIFHEARERAPGEREAYLEAAEKRFREAAEVLRRQPGPPPLLFYPLMGIQRAHLFREELAAARAVAEEAYEVAVRTGGAESRNAAAGMMAVAVVRAHQGEKDAEAKAREALARARRAFPEGHIEIARALTGQGRVLLLARRWQEAEAALREALATARKRYPDPNWRTAEAAALLGVALAGQGRKEEGAALLGGGCAEIAKVLPPAHPRLAELDRLRRALK